MPARFTLAAIAALSVPLAVPIGGAVGGQDSGVTPDGGVETPVRRVVVPEGWPGGDRVPLLREGVVLVKAPGSIRRDETLGVHVFEPEASSTTGVRRELILLPSRGLDDLDRLDGMADPTTVEGSDYEVSGRVLVYRGRNFILPDAIFPVDEIGDSSAPPVPERPRGEGEPPLSEEEIDRIGDEIERRLESRIGAVPRSLDVLGAPRAGRGKIPNGTRFVDRRGRLSRDPASGVWRFVFPGGGGGASSVILLPCLELERIENRAREEDVSTSRLISGTVTTFRGRSYLLPTASRPAVEGRGLGH